MDAGRCQEDGLTLENHQARRLPEKCLRNQAITFVSFGCLRSTIEISTGIHLIPIISTNSSSNVRSLEGLQQRAQKPMVWPSLPKTHCHHYPSRVSLLLKSRVCLSFIGIPRLQ